VRLSLGGGRRPWRFLWWVGAAGFVASAAVILLALDAAALRVTARAALAAPAAVATVLFVYGLAFVLRAWLWRQMLPDLPFGHALAALHVSLAGNHLLPLRLGEALRVTSVVRRTAVPLSAATASTITLRAADVLVVVGLVLVLGGGAVPRVAELRMSERAEDAPSAATGRVRLPATPGLPASAPAQATSAPAQATSAPVRVTSAAVALLGAAAAVWLRRIGRRQALRVRLSGVLVGSGACAAWVLESAVLWQAAAFAGIRIGVADAVLVTALTVAAQVAAVAPAGLGTYEAAGTAGLVALGAPPDAALAAAVVAHAMKTAYALATGAVASLVPAPGLLGRLRLPNSPSALPALGEGSRLTEGPVVLFFPAHDEEITVAEVVHRTPASVLGHRVECLVVDDGSADGTAECAAAAGARVVSFAANRGLGAAVRRGIAEAVTAGAAVVAFCDADGEYAPEELERLVQPILTGVADYVVGSRFAGDPPCMRRHRRLGNHVLTRALSFLARVDLSDGQSGYRALSAAAAAEAEVIHDFNYAQVLTLDLLAKGYRYAEVPISYRPRTAGRSYVRVGAYLRSVIPAVHRELNSVPRLTPDGGQLGG
jgi:uncharacterized membrane protein YbhN (UPF0104 family)